MPKTPPNPPAFPRPASVDSRSGDLHDGNSMVDEQDGMLLLDWYAGRALTGLLAAGSDKGYAHGGATRAFAIAEAMLEERQKRQKRRKAARLKIDAE